jgi:hypothetical protein
LKGFETGAGAAVPVIFSYSNTASSQNSSRVIGAGKSTRTLSVTRF